MFEIFSKEYRKGYRAGIRQRRVNVASRHRLTGEARKQMLYQKGYISGFAGPTVKVQHTAKKLNTGYKKMNTAMQKWNKSSRRQQLNKNLKSFLDEL